MPNTEKEFEKFLNLENLTDPNSEDFGLNHNSQNLHNDAGAQHEKNPPFVLFSSCPIDLINYEKIKTPEHIQWIKENSKIKIQDYEIDYLKPSQEHYDIDSLILNDDFNGRIRQFIEFNENGFIEQGFSFPMIYDGNNDDPSGLSLGRITIGFWCFLYFLKKYYSQMNFSKKIDIRIAIRNSDILTLTGFKGKTERDGIIWIGAYDNNSNRNFTNTYHKNILIKKEIDLELLSDSKIAEIVKLFSNKLANAYDLDSAKCFNHDGTFSFENYINFNNY